jgi:hypothetical protein
MHLSFLIPVSPCTVTHPTAGTGAVDTIKVAATSNGNQWEGAVVVGTVHVFRQNFSLKDAIGSHACSLEALACV